MTAAAVGRLSSSFLFVCLFILLSCRPVCAGKSSYCRSIALNLLLAQTGSFIPAQSGSLTCVDAILARVGAGDSTQRGQSTFMTEMLEAASILRQASPHSLVLIDELGRGTSVDEGFGLAFAIAEHLAARIACFTFFATHFHEVTQLEHEIKGSHNRKHRRAQRVNEA